MTGADPRLTGRVTITDVARHAGVSRATVSTALTRPELVSARALAAVTASANALGYRGNAAARALRRGSSEAIGLLVNDITNPVFAQVARGAEPAAADEGSVVLLANAAEDQERELDYLRFFERQQVRGVLISPVGDLPGELITMQDRGTPFVLIGTQPGAHRYPSVSGDDETGGYLAVTHLALSGRRRVAFVGGPVEQVRNRLSGARRAAQEHGLVLEVVELPAQTTAEGYRATRTDCPALTAADAVFAGNDLLALGVLHALLDEGRRVPEDVAVVGYDDIDFAETAVVPLTTVRHDLPGLGARAVGLLGSALTEPVLLPPELVIRHSA